MHFRFNKVALRGLCSVIPLLMSTNVQAAVINGLIAYSCGSADSHQNICLVNPDGTGKRQITSGGDNGLPSWSPDGKTLAYTHYDVDPASGMPILQIFTLNISDLSTKPVTSGIAPAWSHDGTQIAFSRPSSISPSTTEIWAMRPDGANQHQLTNAPGSQKTGVTWAPDDKSIAYTLSVSDPGHPPPGIHNTVEVTNLVGKYSYELTTSFKCPSAPCFQNFDASGQVIDSQPVLDASLPAWSPTSNEIIFWSGLEGGTGEIWKINSNGKNRKQLTFPPKPPFGLPYPSADEPAWSPDGTKILFSTNRTVIDVPFEPFHMQIPELWMVDADGKNPHAIVESTFGPFPGRAAWQPIPILRTASSVPVPEPASLALLGSALLGFGLIRRRKRM